VRVAVALVLVEEQDLVHVGDEGPVAVGAHEEAAADEDDAVGRIGFLGARRGDVRPAAEVVDAHTHAVEERPARVLAHLLECG